MSAINCWEVKKCGREPGGVHAEKQGVCPVATFKLADGFCGGINGGRACFYILGTFCYESPNGTHKKKETCLHCDFYKRLLHECHDAVSYYYFLKFVRENNRVDF